MIESDGGQDKVDNASRPDLPAPAESAAPPAPNGNFPSLSSKAAVELRPRMLALANSATQPSALPGCEAGPNPRYKLWQVESAVLSLLTGTPGQIEFAGSIRRRLYPEIKRYVLRRVNDAGIPLSDRHAYGYSLIWINRISTSAYWIELHVQDVSVAKIVERPSSKRGRFRDDGVVVPDPSIADTNSTGASVKSQPEHEGGS